MHDVVKAAREAVSGLIRAIDEDHKLSQCRVCYHIFGEGLTEPEANRHAPFCWIGKLQVAVAEFDRGGLEEGLASVCHRTGRLTEADYDEAIEDLKLAKAQAGDRLAGTGAVACAICEDGDHTAESCHHNPLVLARRWAAATRVTSCFHCGYIAYTDEEARAHFGKHDEEVAKCLSDEAQAQIRAKLAKTVFDYYTREIGELMHQAEHWAKPEVEKPLAVHLRLTSATTYYQVVAMFDPERAKKGFGEPFANMETTLARPPINLPGRYPHSYEMHHRYYGPRDVVKRLDELRAEGKDHG